MMKRPLLLVLAFLGLAGGLGLLWLWRHGPHQEALQVRELATRGLAEQLARTFAGHRVLVLSNPFTQQKGLPREMREMEEAGLRGLRQGFGSKLTLAAVAFPELKPEAKENPRAVFIDPETTTPLSFLVADESFDALARKYPDCDLIVSLIGLPANLQQVQCWKDPAGPKFALLLPDLRVIGNRAALRRALETGKLLAFVAAKPGAVSGQKLSGDFNAEFERLFVLVTRDNLESSFLKFPRLFPPD